MYFGKQQYDTALTMPIITRKWMVHRLIQQKEKEKEAAETEMRRAKSKSKR